jgi:NADPH-dependent 2,4-dienoyl-CoA reductase/sulfur reductase-like enzyme/rhodanese-related sulfurtransferase
MTMALDIESEPLNVRVDEAALAETLVALLNNAMKYTPDHGHIRVRARRAEGGDTVVTSVADSGIGVPDELRGKIFEPFFRAMDARRASFPGAGLGLAFVKSVVVGSGGTVAVGRSDLGGAEFTLTLPLAPPEARGGEAQPPLRLVVIGGVTAGPKAAAKVLRMLPDADVTVVERGSVLAYAGCGLPYYVSGAVDDVQGLISSPAGGLRDPVFFRKAKNMHVMNEAEALEIDRADRRVRVRRLAGGHETSLRYDKLLLATGASPAVPEGLDLSLRNVHTVHGVRDAESIRAALSEERARDVVVIGGGPTALDMTDAVAGKGGRVTILEKAPHILPSVDEDMATLVSRYLQSRGVRVVTGADVRALEGDGTVSAVVTAEARYPADMVIIAAGVRPNVDLARRAGLELGETGAIRVDEGMLTSDPDIYAAGDCVETTHLLTGRPVYFPMGATAIKQARVAAVNICGGKNSFSGILGSCICKIFDYSVARVGLGEDEAAAAGRDATAVLVSGLDREHFMPDARQVLLKLIVEKPSRRLLGAQGTGPGDVDKRITAAAVAITAGMTVDEIAELDLCYAPPYSPAMDNLIAAANVARNKLDGQLEGIKPAAVYRMVREKQDFVLLDVRSPQEHERLSLPSALSVPLGTLRERLSALPKDKEIVTFSHISLRGYEASLILRAAGFTRVRVMEGGVAMWPYETLH